MVYTLRKRIMLPALFRQRKGNTAAASYGWVLAVVLVSLLAFVAAMLDADG